MTNEYLVLIENYNKLRKELAPQWLREWRGKMSLAQASTILGCARTYIWKIENHEECINDDLLRRLIQLREQNS